MAIAFDTVTSNSSVTSTSHTFSHTCNWSERMLFVGHLSNTGDFSTGVTYNGVSMTLISKKQVWVTSAWTYLYALFAPSTWTNNVVISVSSSTLIYWMSISYTGVTQSNTMDASATSSVNATTIWASTTLSTTVANCWTVCYSFNNSNIWSTWSDTIRGTNAGVNFWDSNWVIASPSSKTMTQNVSTTGSSASHMVSISPFVASSANPNFLIFF